MLLFCLLFSSSSISHDCFLGTSDPHQFLILSIFPISTLKIPLILASTSHEFQASLSMLMVSFRVLDAPMFLIYFFIFCHTRFEHFQVSVLPFECSPQSSFGHIGYQDVLPSIGLPVNPGVVIVPNSQMSPNLSW